MKVNRLNIGTHLLEHQLSLIDKTMADALKDDMWFFNWTLTPEQHRDFKKYAIPLIRKVFKCNRTRAEETFSWFDFEFGLKIKYP